MKRNIQSVIAQVQALLPSPAPAEVADNVTVLQAELRILARAAAMTPPEAGIDGSMWQRLQTALFRYMPASADYAWAAAISGVVTGGG